MDVIPATMETGAGKQTLHCSVVCAAMGKAGCVGHLWQVTYPCLRVKEGFQEGGTCKLRSEE